MKDESGRMNKKGRRMRGEKTTMKEKLGEEEQT
jgi:hypothetical protein